jgi:hypothetical protein
MALVDYLKSYRLLSVIYIIAISTLSCINGNKSPSLESIEAANIIVDGDHNNNPSQDNMPKGAFTKSVKKIEPKKQYTKWNRPPLNGPKERLEYYRPKKQTKFIDIINKYRVKYSTADNDIAKLAIKKERADEIRRLMKKSYGKIERWVGKLISKGTSPRGLFNIALSISEDDKCWLVTNIDDNKDINYNTLIPKTSRLSYYYYDYMATPGTFVRFSGRLFPDELTYIKEINDIESDSMEHPEYLIRFSEFRYIADSLW